MRTKILGDTYSFEFDLVARKDELLDSEYYLKIKPNLMTSSIYDAVYCGMSDGVDQTSFPVRNIVLEFQLLKFDAIDENVALSALTSIIHRWAIEHSLQRLDPDFLL